MPARLESARIQFDSYLNKLHDITSNRKHPITIAELVKLENPVLEAKFHAGNPAYKDDRYEHFKAQVGYFIEELKRKGVSKYLLGRISQAQIRWL